MTSEKRNEMIVFKFGGASVKSSEAVKNIVNIVDRFSDKMVIVVSAIGKTTNALEGVTKSYFEGDSKLWNRLEQVKAEHVEIADGLFSPKDAIHSEIHDQFHKLENLLKQPVRGSYDFIYDQIVSFGEILSTKIVAAYLNSENRVTSWIDIRECLKTDETYREGRVLWEESENRVKETFLFEKSEVYLTQGFIGSTFSGHTTTLGREGSDYTAALLANMLDAESLTIWKDVPGVLNADPQWLSDNQLLEVISYKEAIELSYFGAKVIHPKTLKPLQNKSIPMYVKSFLNPDATGTVISDEHLNQPMPPCFIKKTEQVLITLFPKDLSFVIEDGLSKIFALFYKYNVKVNLIQNSAVSFSVCIDNHPIIEKLFNEFTKDFELKYNGKLELITIRHYTKEAINRIIDGREVMLKQQTRTTSRFVLR